MLMVLSFHGLEWTDSAPYARHWLGERRVVEAANSDDAANPLRFYRAGFQHRTPTFLRGLIPVQR